MKHIFTSFKQSVKTPLLIACALLAMSSNAWGGSSSSSYSYTWIAKTAVGKGTGTAKVYIRKSALSTDKEKSTTGSTLVEANHNESGTQVAGIDAVLPRYAEFEATPGTGYHFVAWYTNAACTGTAITDNSYTTDSKKPSNNSTCNLGSYYAKFELNTYKVKFNSNGGTSGSMSDQTFTYGTAQKLTANAFKKTGYKFLYWNTKADGTGTSYTNKKSVNNLTTENGVTVNLYAIWGRLAAKSPSAGDVEFGDVTIGKASDWKAMSIEHYRAGTVSLTQTGDADDFFIGDETTSTSECDSFSSSSSLATKTIQVQFRPTANGLRTCTLTVSSDVTNVPSVVYYLKGEGYSTPTVTWMDGDGNELTSGETTLSVGDVLKATCTSSQTISYSNFNTSYFTAGTDGNGAPILTVNENISGTINDLSVVANLAKNTTTHFIAYTDTIKLNVTNLIPQTIEWNDDVDLSNEGMPYNLTLGAVARNAKTGEETGQPITYRIASNSSLSLSGSTLSVQALGGPYAIMATAEGSDAYAPMSMTKYFTVINMTDPCSTLDTSYVDGSFNKTYTHEISVATPDTLTFTATRESSLLRKDLKIIEYDANNKELKTTTKGYREVSTSGTTFKIKCQDATTKIIFKASASATYTYYISDISTTRRTKYTISDTELSYATEPGEGLHKKITITHSNTPIFLSFKSDELAEHVGTSKWSLDVTHLGGCGKRGSQYVTVSFRANQKGLYTDSLYICDNVGTLLKVVNLSATVTVRPQHLDTWNIASTYNTTDQTTLAATTEEGRSNFDFKVKNSNPEGIVSISNTGVMTFNGSGTAQIVAHESGGGIYDEYTSEPYSITINKVTPTISVNPTATGVKCYGTLSKTQLSGGKATVTLRGVANTEVGGHFEWKNEGSTVNDKAGLHEYTVVFKPNSSMYNDKEFTIQVDVAHADAALAMLNSSVDVTLPGDAKTLDLSALINAQTGDGDVTFAATGENASHVTINGNNLTADAAGEYAIVATAAETDYYASATSEPFTVTVNRRTPNVSTANLNTVVLTYGEALSSKGISGNMVITDLPSDNTEDATATCAWANGSDKPAVGVTSATATFTSAHSEWFEPVTINVPVTVNPVSAKTYAATATISEGQSLSEAVFVNGAKGLDNETVDGTISWDNTVDQTLAPEVRNGYEFRINFTSHNANYTDGTGVCIVNVEPATVWDGSQPANSSERVVTNSNVEVTEAVTLGGLTINAGDTVTVKDGATLTIGEYNSLTRNTYGDIIVETGGKLNLTENGGELKVNDFTLYSGFDSNKKPKSGQVAGQQQLTTRRDAYFVLDLDSAGVASYGWYGFTVPFPVDALNGITRFENGGWQTITNEVNYAIMDYHEDLRAQGKYGWKKYRGILQPGTGYLMTVENAVNRYRFRMVEGGAFNAAMTQNLVATEGSELDKGWNSIGNGTMAYVSYDEMPRYAQLLDHKNNTYQIIRTASNAFVVGAAYFVQTTDNSTLTMIDASDATTGLLRAPQRRQMDEEYCSIDLSLSADGRTCDNLFITCSDNAVTTYTIGKDVLKMGATSDATVARLWSPAKDAILGAVDMPFSNDEAVIPLNIYAPKAGEYALTVDNSPTEDICLMRDGVMVWNMSTGAFALDLTAGTDRSYALRVTRRTNNVATGAAAADVDQCGADLVEKIIVNGQFFILRNGVMYDAQGRKVANF